MLLVISDTHLSAHFDPVLAQLLTRVINDADQVVLNGDVWDMYLTKFDSFVSSKWSILFQLLLEKRAIYLPGNHDPVEKMNDSWHLFAEVLTDTWTVHAGEQTIHITHGHRHSRSFEARHPQIAKYTNKGYPLVDYVEDRRPWWGEPILRYMQQESIDRRDELQAFARRQRSPGTAYIFGHAHLPLADEANHCYIPGACKHGTARWITVNNAGKIEVNQEKY